MASSIAVVTDSTATLPAETAASRGITVVPLQVIIGSNVYDEGAPEAAPTRVAAALKEFVPVSTSRPAPRVFAETYARLAEEGAEAIVSLHLSGEVSGTFESAQLAARDSSVPVHVVDTHEVGPATGYAALTAADARDDGAGADEMAALGLARAERSVSLFYVDTLEYLRRGGRVGAAAAFLGGKLAVKPLLTISDGRVTNLDRVRTASRALARLQDLAVEHAGDRAVDVTVAHLAGETRAAELSESLAERLADNLQGREIATGELGAVLGAHVGPGMVAVCVAPREAD